MAGSPSAVDDQPSVRKVALASSIGAAIEWVRLLPLRHRRRAAFRGAGTRVRTRLGSRGSEGSLMNTESAPSRTSSRDALVVLVGVYRRHGVDRGLRPYSSSVLADPDRQLEVAGVVECAGDGDPAHSLGHQSHPLPWTLIHGADAYVEDPRPSRLVQPNPTVSCGRQSQDHRVGHPGGPSGW